MHLDSTVPLRLLTAEFKDPAIEGRYRAATLPEYRRRTVQVVGLLVVFGLALLLRDVFSSAPFSLLEVAWTRIVLVALGVVVLVIVLRTRSQTTLDAVLVTCALLLVAGLVLTHLYQPNLQEYHHATDVLILFVVGLAVPNRFVFQLVPAVAVGVAAIVQSLGESAVALGTAVVIFSAAVVIASAAAHHANTSARRLFWAREKIRTLEGIVSICGKCKAIRDSDDEWRRVEEFVARGPDAVFSHGLCPACLDESMAEVES